MKNTYLSLLFCLFACVGTMAQQETLNLAPDELSDLISKHFIQYSTGQATASSSSFAGLDIDKTEFTFSPTYVTKNSNVWNAKFKGGITDGMASLFNNNKFNTNMGIELEYNLNLCKKGGNIKVGFMEDDYVKFRNGMIDLHKKNLAELKTLIAADKVLKQNDYISKIDEALKPSDDNTLRETENQLYSLYKALKTEIESLISNRSNFDETSEEKILDAFSAWSNAIAKMSKDRLKEFKFSQFRSKWLTIGVHVRNDQFRLLDRAQLYEDQVEKTTYINYGGKIQYNNYSYKRYGNSVFYNMGLNYQNKCNFRELGKTSIVENGSIGTDGITTRISDDKYTAYEGEYIKYLDQLDLNADFFYFVNRFQNTGIHVYTNSKFMETLKPSHNVGIGLVFPFKNKEKESTVINAEIYYTLTNVFNTENTTFGLMERNDIGLRFTFPIDFNPN